MTVDTIVIGAGVVGASTARSLAEAGASVLLLEAFERGHDRGSSHGATRIFRYGYDATDYVRLSVRAAAGWQRLEELTGRTVFDPTGALDHGDPQALDAIAAAMAAQGLPGERLRGAEAAERWPGLRFEDDVLFSPGGGRLHAAAAIDALLDLAEAAGAELRFGVRVSSIDTDGDRVVVTTAGGEHRADRLVVAAGSWTPTLAGAWLARNGAALPEVRVTEEQPAHFPLHPGAAADEDRWPSFVHHPTRLGTPSVYGLLTPGEGVKVGVHGDGPVVDPDHRDRTISATRLERLQRYVAEWVPGVDASRPHSISCLYDTTPNSDFVLDRVGAVTVATGFSGHGFKFGPALGDVLARLALHGERAPERFRLAVAEPG
jgi:sarcosine oxidase